MPFCDHMAAAYSAADIAVSRAGAGTLAELAACRTPAVLVPYPRAADDHQTANARAREVVGASILCPESELSTLMPALERLIAQPQLRAQMREALAREHLLNRWDDLVDDIVLGVRREVSP
jgi:UDP-N-acetylglucosamine--N-acetylmuramyl-(pentapeptide) pyrophosphoryl-undecaprenol N-acetylglucosamine transferase